MSDAFEAGRSAGDGGCDEAAGGGARLSSATEALRRAKAELKKAQEMYQDVRRRTVEGVEAVRKTSVGDLLDGAMEVIKKHPGPALLGAALAGFFLGRRMKQ
jgi:hypothetical protein